MIRSALKFLFRVYVSFSNPAYVDWRRQLRLTLRNVVSRSDKLFLIMMAIAILTMLLEIIGYLIGLLVSKSHDKFVVHVFVIWFLSISSFIIAGSIWCKGFLQQLIRMEIFRTSLFRSYAWGLYMLGAALQGMLFYK